MSKSLRLSEKWFRRGLWLVAFVFAGFLIGLGSGVVGDLPQVERRLQLEDFIDQPAAQPLHQALEESQKATQAAERELAQAELQLEAAAQARRNARQSFSDWVQTRRATERPEQDDELIARTRALDGLQTQQDQAQQRVDAQRQAALDAKQQRTQAEQRLQGLESQGYERMRVAQRSLELRVFGYRLALTLPLLALAGWLFVKRRHGTYWPFVWGFIFFALFAFFVELVPYLPSYGGYVRYGVGIVLTVLIGRYAILALNRYLARQQLAEAQPDRVRREELSYDTALARLAKGVCPGCERPVDLKDTSIDFCPHCGIGLHDHCGSCETRKSAFSRFCHGCGSTAHGAPSAPAPAQASAST